MRRWWLGEQTEQESSVQLEPELSDGIRGCCNKVIVRQQVLGKLKNYSPLAVMEVFSTSAKFVQHVYSSIQSVVLASGDVMETVTIF